MGVYQKLCYKVEDVFVKMLTQNQDKMVVTEKVETYRTKKNSVGEEETGSRIQVRTTTC
ncbi:hypothetical protein [Bacillus solitudinis]|uniref:hypothetical protein n=1 Tax=Bacillus solitudinis TaxID=2014074 RepID=UPI0012FE5BE8|nr:hypothetical protein [Bacillus solitudinis]